MAAFGSNAKKTDRAGGGSSWRVPAHTAAARTASSWFSCLLVYCSVRQSTRFLADHHVHNFGKQTWRAAPRKEAELSSEKGSGAEKV